MTEVGHASTLQVQHVVEPSSPADVSAPVTSAPKPASTRTWAWAVGAIVPALVVVGWEIVARLQLIPTNLFPPPTVIAQTIAQLARTGELWTHMYTTLWRVALGFGFGVASGTVLGSLTGYSTWARRLL
ncbi:MAG TPA: hypothetical protein VF678_13860, partial [bacterium]